MWEFMQEHVPATQSSAQSPTLDHAIEQWLHVIEVAGEASPRHLIESRRIYERIWRPALGAIPISDLTVNDLNAVLDPRRGELATTTIRKIVSPVRSALAHAMSLGLLTSNPAAALRLGRATGRRVDVISPEESDLLLAELARTPAVAGACTVLRHTGMRRGEVCGLRRSDLLLAGAGTASLHVERTLWQSGKQWGLKRPKTVAGDRRIPIGSTLEKRLLRLLRSAEDLAAAAGLELADDPWLFSEDLRHSQPLLPDRITAEVRRASLRLLAEGRTTRSLHAHQWRHAAATALIAGGRFDAPSVAAVLGHANPAVTLSVYAKARIPLAEMAQALDEV
jgi:integrase